ncbi:MAG TPA: rhomboid family intramembrane serine protease [Solirubrobacteraceae bacterium]|jgi:membrane associated rhomboid family serine protease|nr:rhomboid family intramembrane serine protease [Solirubrobacteraceae bacterium]
MSRGADLFIVCKNPECRSEVSPYVTECPYCGTRLRKRAPKLERGGRPVRSTPPRRVPAPSLGRLRADEIPGIRGESRPWATAAIVVLTCVVWIVVRGGYVSVFDLPLDGPLNGEWWRLVSSLFSYVTPSFGFGNGVVQFGTLMVIVIFGWLLERRHGHIPVLLVFLLCGAGGAALAVAASSTPRSFGANAAALGLLTAWAVPHLRARRSGDYDEADLLGVAAAAGALALMPLARPEVNAVASAGGAVIGLACGLLLARLRP